MIQLFDTNSGEKVADVQGHTRPQVVRFSPGDYLATASYRSGLRLWKLPLENSSPVFEGHQGYIRSVTFSEDGTLLASGGSGGVILWDTATWEKTDSIDTEEEVLCVDISQDGKSLVYCSGDEIHLWDTENRAPKGLIGVDQTDSVWSLAISPDNKAVVSGSSFKTLSLWDISGKSRKDDLIGHQSSIRSVAFSPDGGTLASGGDYIYLWNTETREGRRLTQFRGDAWAMAFSPDGKMLATGSHVDGAGNVGIRLWSVETGEELGFISGPDVSDVAFFPDGSTLAAVGQRIVSLWDTKTLQERAHFELDEGSREAEALAVPPDGKTIVIGRNDGSIQVWQAADREEVRNSGW